MAYGGHGTFGDTETQPMGLVTLGVAIPAEAYTSRATLFHKISTATNGTMVSVGAASKEHMHVRRSMPVFTDMLASSGAHMSVTLAGSSQVHGFVSCAGMAVKLPHPYVCDNNTVIKNSDTPTVVLSEDVQKSIAEKALVKRWKHLRLAGIATGNYQVDHPGQGGSGVAVGYAGMMSVVNTSTEDLFFGDRVAFLMPAWKGRGAPHGNGAEWYVDQSEPVNERTSVNYDTVPTMVRVVAQRVLHADRLRWKDLLDEASAQLDVMFKVIEDDPELKALELTDNTKVATATAAIDTIIDSAMKVPTGSVYAFLKAAHPTADRYETWCAVFIALVMKYNDVALTRQYAVSVTTGAADDLAAAVQIVDDRFRDAVTILGASIAIGGRRLHRSPLGAALRLTVRDYKNKPYVSDSVATTFFDSAFLYHARNGVAAVAAGAGTYLEVIAELANPYDTTGGGLAEAAKIRLGYDIARVHKYLTDLTAPGDLVEAALLPALNADAAHQVGMMTVVRGGPPGRLVDVVIHR